MTERTSLLVVGAGATGGYFGAVASRGGLDVTFVARGAHGAAMAERGVRVVGPAGELTARPRVVNDLAHLGAEAFDVVLVTVKSKDLSAVLPACASLVAPGGAIVTGQNGVDAEDEALRFVPAEALGGGVLVIGASVPEPGVVRYQGMALALIGAARPEGTAAVRRAVERLVGGGVHASFTPDLPAMRWAKLVWNNAWNALTALTRLPVGAAAADPALCDLGIRMMREVEAVARAQGIALPDNIVDVCLAQARAMGDARPSMLQDVEAGRPLEHEALVGVVVRRGRALGVPTPVNEVVLPLLAALSR